jgi:hypothetical protein
MSKKKTSRWLRFERYLELASEAGSIAMSLRDQPTRLDWFALGARALGLGAKIRAESARARAVDPWDFFDTDPNEGSGAPRWIEVPEEFRKLVFQHIGEAEREDSCWDGSPSQDRVWLGRVGNEVVGWLQNTGGDVVDGPYILAERERETFSAIGERLWRRLGTDSAAYTRDGLVADAPTLDGVIPSTIMRELRERIDKFLAAGVSRSYLFAGPPGTGKSVCIRYLAGSLGLTSLRVDLTVLSDHYGYHADHAITNSVETLAKLLQPDMMILDDIDRVKSSGRLLHFLEFAAREFKLVLASANCTQQMMGAALRPGRFDEVVTIDKLDREVLESLVDGCDSELLDRLSALPIAYVAEFVKRRAVLGHDSASAELEDLVKRLAVVNGQTSSGN